VKPTFRTDDDGNEVLAMGQMAVLLGVPEKRLTDEWRRQYNAAGRPPGQFVFRLPDAWARNGQARMRLAGTDDLAEALVILAALDELGALPETP
jgi:hypothetical protein